MSNNPGKQFQENVPTFDYNKIFDAWWYKAKDGSPDWSAARRALLTHANDGEAA